MSLQAWTRGILLIAVLAAVSAFLFHFRHEPVSKATLSEPPKLVNNAPIGEIVQGFRAEQHVTAKLAGDRLDRLKGSGVCVEILLANYSNRPNTGQFAIGLVLDGRQFVQQVDAAAVTDNATRSICFTDVTVGALFAAREVRLMLLGLSSPPGAAVTAWTTADLSAGQLAGPPGSPSSRSLIFHFSTQVDGQQGRRNALVLISLGALAISTVILSRPGPAPMRPQARMQGQAATGDPRQRRRRSERKTPKHLSF